MSIELPIGWTSVTPEDVATDTPYALAIGPFGSNLKVSDYTNAGVPLVFVRHIRAERFDSDNSPCVSLAKAKELAAHWVHGGDVLVTKMGEPPGDSALYPAHMKAGVITADCLKWSVDSRVGNAKFFMYALRTPAVRRNLLSITQGVAQRKISLGRFKTLRFPCPPLPEQRRIVEALDSNLSRLDAAVESLETAQRKLKAYRASVLKAAVEGRLVPTEADLARNEGRSYEPADMLLQRILRERRGRWEEAELAKMKAAGKAPNDDRWKANYDEPAAPRVSELSHLPEGWCWATTAQLFSFVTSGSRGWAQYYSESGPMFIRIGNLDHDSIRLDLSDIQRVSPPAGAEGTRTRVVAGDVLVSITADVGMIAVVPDEIGEAYINQHISLARPVGGMVTNYLAWFLAAAYGGQRQFLALQRGATKVGLGLEDIRSVLVPIPPLAEQGRIVDEVERCLSVAAECHSGGTANQRRIRQLRQAVLRLAFEGRLVDQDPIDEPADALLARIRAERAGAPLAKPKQKPSRRLKAAS